MKFEKKPSFEDYLAGSCLANVPFWIFIILDSYNNLVKKADLLAIIYLMMIISGGMMSGYLVARKSTENSWKVGLMTGFSAFIVNVIFSFSLFRNANGFLWILLVFLIGGYIGSIIKK